MKLGDAVTKNYVDSMVTGGDYELADLILSKFNEPLVVEAKGNAMRVRDVPIHDFIKIDDSSTFYRMGAWVSGLASLNSQELLFRSIFQAPSLTPRKIFSEAWVVRYTPTPDELLYLIPYLA